MVEERLYINNTLIELPKGDTIELVYQSPLFTDIDKIVANRTNNVSIPLTTNNRRAMKLAGIAKSDFAYRKHTARYYRDGVEIFNGYATLLSMSHTSAEFCFTWGNTSAFQKLFDAKLQDLQSDEQIFKRYIAWANTAMSSTEQKYFPNGVSFTKENIVTHKPPIIPVEDIMQAIELHTGVSGLQGVFSDYAIPLLTKKTNEVANEAQGTQITAATFKGVGANLTGSIYLKPTTSQDLLGILAEDSQLIHTAEYDTLTIDANIIQYTIIGDPAYYEAGIDIQAVDENGQNPVSLATIPTTLISSSTNTRTYRAQLARTEINVSDYSYIAIRLMMITNTFEGDSLTVDNISLKLIPDIDKEQEVLFNTYDTNVANYPIYLNLPDWSMSQLVKNLMKLSGLFAYAKSNTEIGFVSVSDLYTNRADAYNWSDKVLGGIEELTPTFENLAQQNTLKYAEDDTVSGDYNGVIYVDNEALDTEGELLSVDFAPTYQGLGGLCTIALYTTNEEGEIEYNDALTPRVLKYADKTSLPYTVTFEGMSFHELTKSVYADYQTTIRTPRVMRRLVHIGTLDLANLDLIRPVYLEQERKYFAIISLSTKNNRTAEVQLLQMEKSIERPLLSTNPNHNLLAVVRNDNGEYITTLPKVSRGIVEAVRLNSRYKVVMLREGYARRGKAGKKIDRIYGEIGTHTTRKPSFREYRGGYKLRIIGAEILSRGSISDHSQSCKRYYGFSTLVSSLGDALVLPSVRIEDGGIVRTKSGRIQNNARKGLMKLFVALYYKDEKGKWLRISNAVQVRGLTQGNMTYWEFSEGNILE